MGSAPQASNQVFRKLRAECDLKHRLATRCFRSGRESVTRPIILPRRQRYGGRSFFSVTSPKGLQGWKHRFAADAPDNGCRRAPRWLKLEA